MEGFLDHDIRRREGRIHVARLDSTLERQVVAEIWVDHRSCGVERGLHVDDGDQFFERNLDQCHRIFGLGAGLRDNGNYRLTLPARAVHRQRVLGRRFQTLQVGQHTDPGRAMLRHLGAGDNAHHAGAPLRRRHVDRSDRRMGIGTAQEGDMHQTR